MRRPGEVLYPGLMPDLIPGSASANSLFENRSLVTIPIENEHDMPYGTQFLFETRPMIDFQRGNEHYGSPFRYLGRRAIFPT